MDMCEPVILFGSRVCVGFWRVEVKKPMMGGDGDDRQRRKLSEGSSSLAEADDGYALATASGSLFFGVSVIHS